MSSTIHVGRGDLTSTTHVSRLEDLDLSQIEPDSVDVVVMSAPYYERDGCSVGLAHRIGELLQHALKPGGRAFHVFGQVAEDFAMPFVMNSSTKGGASSYATRQAGELHCSKCKLQQGQTGHRCGCDGQNVKWEPMGGWRPQIRQEQTLFWIKSMSYSEYTSDSTVSAEPVSGHQTPLQGANMVNDAVEFIFQYSKPLPRTGRAAPLDRLAEGVAVPYADLSNLKRGTRGKNGNRRCRGTAVFIPYETVTSAEGSKKEHRHAFPVALADYLIRLSGVPKGSTVCDCFEGGGSTRTAAEALGMNYVGVKWEGSES